MAVVLATGAGAVRVRCRLVPGWSGPPAWLVDIVVAVALVLWTAELLGAFGAFREAPFVASTVALGLGLRFRLWAPARAARVSQPRPAAPPAMPLAAAIAFGVAGLVIAHWSIGVRLSLDSGITNFDSTWYHGPFAARFAQSGSTFDLDFIAPQFLAWFYPANSELLHGAGVLAFDRDIISPLINVAWLAGALLAAWCIGRPYGAGPLSLIGVAVVLDSGALADQAGSMRNDIVATFFLLAGAAIAVNAWSASRDSRLTPAQLGLIGLAGGLAAGTKLNYLVPAVGLALGALVLAGPGRRRMASLAVGLPLLAGCGFWYLRNLIQAGSPIPWLKSIGPLALPSPDQAIGGRDQASVVHYLLDSSVWSDWFFPGLNANLGHLWPLIAGLAVVALIACLGRRQEGIVRVLGGVGLLTLAGWAFAPASASGPEGMPLGFESGLRYLAPALALGLALLPALTGIREAPRRLALLVLLLVALCFADASALPWYSGYVAGAVAVGAAAAVLAALPASRRLRGAPRPLLAAAAVVALLLAVGGGWLEQRRYLRHRYADPGFAAPGLNAAFAWAQDLSGKRIVTTGTREYPLYGTELSNRVQFAGVHRAHGGFVATGSCVEWRRALNSGGYDYAVATLDRIEPGAPVFPPQARWTHDPKARVVLRKPPTVVFRLRGRLDPRGCAALDESRR